MTGNKRQKSTAGRNCAEFVRVGYCLWEGKDEKTNIDDEISLKIKTGYPLTNILFEVSGALKQVSVERNLGIFELITNIFRNLTPGLWI